MSKEVSKYVSYKEVCHSNTALAMGFKNEPSDEQLELIRYTAKTIFDPLREHANEVTGKNAPIKMNSAYRGDELNEEIGGSKTSQHSVGLDPAKSSHGAAFDIDDEYWLRGRNELNNVEMADWIRLNCDFDQLIYEFPINGYPKWIHFSSRPDCKNRNQVLIATKRKNDDGKWETIYLPYAGNEHLIKNPEMV